MSPAANKIMWVVEVLLEDGPRTTGDIERTTQFPHRVLHDAVYQLVADGRVRIRPDSKLELA